MANERKYFFTHDVDAHADIKIRKLIKKFGYEGYGLWWHLIEELRNQNDYKLEYVPDDLEILFYDTKLNIKEFIDECIKIKLLANEDNYIFSKSLNRRMDIYQEVREIKSKAGKIGMQKRWQKEKEVIENDNRPITELYQCYNSVITDDNRPITDDNYKTKQNKTKENKKENKIKQNNIEENNESVVVDVVGETYKFFKSLFPEMKLDTADWMTMSMYAKEKPELFKKACQIGKESDAKTFKYITGIINNWEGQGVESINDLIPKKKSKFANYDEVKIDYENFDEDNLNKLLEKYGGTN